MTWTREERHEHAIQEHKFPPDFRFDEVKRKSKSVSNGDTNKPSQQDKSKTRKKKFSVDVKSSSENSVNGSTKARRPLSLARLGEHFRDKDSESMDVDDSTTVTSDVTDQPPVTPRAVTKEPSSASASSSSSSTGKKSRIPVRSNSCKLPKQLSFGAGVPRGFLSTRVKSRVKDWHTCHMTSDMETVTSIETADMRDLRDSLPV